MTSRSNRLPHLRPFERQPIVFLTVCTGQRRPLLANRTAEEILRTIWIQAADSYGWYVGHYVLMPDHVHLFVQAGFEEKSLGRWVQMWKSLSARRLAADRGDRSPIWQRDYFDRFLRSNESYVRVWRYVWENPRRAGLVDDSEQWPYCGTITDLRPRE